MITHITVEDAAKLVSRLTNANEMQALTYIREAADRGEIQAADALEELQAENEKLKAYMNDAYGTMHNIYGACGAYCDAEISDFWQRWHSQKEG